MSQTASDASNNSKPTLAAIPENLPERFNLTYVGADGKEHQPYMVHRALLGSIERFFGILIEHYAGAFPLWLAPEQVRVLPITDKQLDYAKKIETALREAGYRVEVDTGAEKLGAKIRNVRHRRGRTALCAFLPASPNGLPDARAPAERNRLSGGIPEA